MRLAISLITFSFLLTGCPGVKKPDAFLCTFIVKDPVENSYSFCVNTLTKEEKRVPAKEMLKWVTTDPDSYEKLREYFKEQCKNLQN